MDSPEEGENQEDKYKDKEEDEDLLMEFSERVTLHGFRYIIVERGAKWMIWILIMIFSIASCVLLSYNNIESFAARAHYQVETVDYSPTEAQFPTVTFCLINQFKGGEQVTAAEVAKCSDEYNLTWSELKKCHKFEPSLLITPEIELFASDQTCLFNNKRCDFVDEVKMTTVWPEKVCIQFNGFSTNHGNNSSYRVNNSSYRVNNPGLIHNGLMVYLDLHQVEPVSGSLPYHGIEVIVEPYGNQGFMIDSTTSPVYAVPGSLNILDLSHKKEVLLPSPYSTACGEKKSVILNDNKDKYIRSNCITDCILQNTTKTCGCVPPDVKGVVDDDRKICKGEEEVTCYKKIIQSHVGVETECHQQCPLACEREFYEVRMSQATLGSVSKLKKVAARYCKGEEDEKTCTSNRLHELRTNFIGIYIGFNSFKTSTITATPSATLAGFLGTIGGSIGLCLGFSVVTAFEFTMFIVDLIKKKMNKQKRVQPQP